MDSKQNAYILKDRHLPVFSSKSQVKVPPFKVSPDQSSRITDHVEEPRFFTPILRPQAVASGATWKVVKPIPRHVNVVAPLQYPGRRILHPVPGFLRRHLASGNNSGNDQSRLPPKKRRFIDAGEGDGPAAKVSKSVINDESGFLGFSHSENSKFSAYRPPSSVRPKDLQLADAQPGKKETSPEATITHAPNAYSTDIEASYHANEVADIMENAPQKSLLTSQNEATAAHNQNTYSEDSDDEDSEIAGILENAGNKEYPILGYRVVMLTPGDDEYETDDDEYDDDYIANEDGYDKYRHNDVYQDDDDYQDYADYDGYDHENESESDNVQITDKAVCQSPSEPWLPEVRDFNNSRAGSETMNDVMMDCFRPITPVVIRFSPDSTADDGSVVSTPSAKDSELSLSNFSPIAISSSSTVGSISDFSMSSTPDYTNDNTTVDSYMEITNYANLPDVLSTDVVKDYLKKAEEDTIASSKPLLEVRTSTSTSLAEFRASVMKEGELSVRRYEEWFVKSKDEQFAEFLKDFLEENEGLLYDQEDKIRSMLADTRDRIAERRKAVREARETVTRPSLSRGISNDDLVEIMPRVSSGSPNDDSMEAEDDTDYFSVEIMSVVSGGSSNDDLMEIDGGDDAEASSDEDHEVEPSTSGEKLCRHISSFFGHSGCAKYISYCRNELQTYADQDFYSMFSEHKSPASEDNKASSNNDGIDSQASSHNDHTYSLPSSYADSSQCLDNADIIVID